MTKQRNRLTQVEFTGLVIWLKDNSHEKSTISDFCAQANKALEADISEDSVARAIHEFGLAEKLLVAPKINRADTKLSDKVKALEEQIEELAFKIFALEEAAKEHTDSNTISQL